MRVSVSDVGLKLAALLMACAFAMHVCSVSGDVRTIDVVITAPHVPNGFEVRLSPESARVHIRGTEKDFQRLEDWPPVIRIEPGLIPRPGAGTIPLSPGNVIFGPGGFTGNIERIDPAEVRVEIVAASGEPETPRNP